MAPLISRSPVWELRLHCQPPDWPADRRDEKMGGDQQAVGFWRVLGFELNFVELQSRPTTKSEEFAVGLVGAPPTLPSDWSGRTLTFWLQFF